MGKYLGGIPGRYNESTSLTCRSAAGPSPGGTNCRRPDWGHGLGTQKHVGGSGYRVGNTTETWQTPVVCTRVPRNGHKSSDPRTEARKYMAAATLKSFGKHGKSPRPITEIMEWGGDNGKEKESHKKKRKGKGRKVTPVSGQFFHQREEEVLEGKEVNNNRTPGGGPGKNPKSS